MLRFVSFSLFAVSVCSLQSGCCCCRLPAAFMRAGGPIVLAPPQPPPIAFEQPPIVFQQPPPPVIQPPVIDPFKDPFKDINAGKDKGAPNAPKDGFIDPFQGKGFGLGKTRYIFSQGTGQFKTGNQLLGIGYSGKGPARNQPAMQVNKDGPIPVGEYMILDKGVNRLRPGLESVTLGPCAGGNFFNRFPFEPFAIISETNPPNNPPSGAILVLPPQVYNQLITGEQTTKLAVIQ